MKKQRTSRNSTQGRCSRERQPIQPWHATGTKVAVAVLVKVVKEPAVVVEEAILEDLHQEIARAGASKEWHLKWRCCPIHYQEQRNTMTQTLVLT